MFFGKNSPDRFYSTSITCWHILQTFWMAGHDFEKEAVRVILNTEIVLPRIFKGLHSPIYLPTYLPTGLPTHRPTYLPTGLPTYLPTGLCTNLSICTFLPIYLFTCVPSSLPIYLQEYLPSYIQIYPPTCRSRYLPTGQPTYLHTHPPPTYLPNKAYGNMILCCIALLYDWHLLPFHSIAILTLLIAIRVLETAFVTYKHSGV